MGSAREAITTNRPAFHFGLRSMLTALCFLAVLLAGYGWYHRRYVEPRYYANAIQRRLESLVDRRPKEMSPRQWESAVAWTLNLHGNSLMRFQAKGAAIASFDERLAKKLAGPVDMSTVHWIWDEYAGICRGGASYQRFRPMMLEEIEAGGGHWGMNIP
jgi:hypothetical protein